MKKFGVFIPLFLTILLAFSIISNVNAAPDIIYSHTEDGYVDSNNSVYDGFTSMRIGDWSNNAYSRGLIKFSLSGVSGTLSSATLMLKLWYSEVDGVQDAVNPILNPGLGDLQVIHIADYGTLSADDFDDTSIGNDPGVLIGGSTTPNAGYISIDVTASMQDDLDNDRSFSAFMLRLATNTDNDDNYDYWSFFASEWTGTANDPFIEYELAPENPVGGIYAPIDKLNILAPYIALVGLIGAVSTIFTIRRWCKD